ncbi:MAG: hypothetical protein KH147_02665 [Actinomyces graevenitzii]|nr:hypothetical protein [Actinomyces graevenitzii]
MKGFKNKPAVLPAAEPSAAKFGEDEAAPETRFEGGGEANGEAHLEGGAKGSGEVGIAGHKKKRAGSGLPPWLRIKPQDRWPLVRVALVVVLCISAGWYFVDFYGGKDAQAGQALPGGGAAASASVSRAGARGTVSATPTSIPAPSASVKWTPTAQEAKKRAEALSMPLPAKPEEITQNTDDGAVATAKYAIELYNYAFATGNVDEYAKLCKGTHKSCATTPDVIKKMHANGGWVDKLQVTFTSGWVRKDIKDELIVQLWYYQSDGFEYSGTGSNLDLKQGKRAALVSLSYNGSSWQVEMIYVEKR